MSEYVCICKNPLSHEEKTEFENIIYKYKGKKLRNYLWTIPTGEHIRFLHYIVQLVDRMKEVKKVMEEMEDVRSKYKDGKWEETTL